MIFLRASSVLLLGAVGWTTAPAAIVINEIMYNTPGGTDVEYVELVNTGPAAQSMSGWSLLDDDNGHVACPLSGTIGVGQYLIVAGRLDLFAAAYPGAGPVNPTPFDSTTPGAGYSLGNEGDTVRLFQGPTLRDSVTYDDASPWPVAADGTGPSLELRNPGLDNALAANWGASVDPPPRGTPGEQNSIFVFDPPPAITQVKRDPALPQSTDSVSVTATATDPQGISFVEIWVDTGSGFVASAMFDDGAHGDGAAGDSVYGRTLAPQPTGTLVRYYLVAQDTLSQSVSFPALAPAAYLAYTVGHALPPLAIHEILASNQLGIVDENGDPEDWLEIRNRGPETIELEGMFLSDDPTNSQMWPLPATDLGPGQFLLIWCDAEPTGPFHANFDLARERGEVGLYETVDHGNVLVHGMRYGLQSPDVSFGFRPDDADAPEYLATPTPAAGNDSAVLQSPICINEFLAASQLPGAPDWVELHNRSGASVDVSGWYLSDDAANPAKFQIPPATVIPAGGFLSFDDAELGYGLATAGEELQLTAPDGLTGQDYVVFGSQNPDVSRGRFPNGSANWHSFSPATREDANDCDIGIPPLARVVGVSFSSREALSWSAVAGAAAYDVVRGDLAPLAGGAGYAVAIDACVENNRAGLEAWDDELPAVGNGFVYLVRGVNFSCGFGTYDSGSASQLAPRDAAIAASPAACP